MRRTDDPGGSGSLAIASGCHITPAPPRALRPCPPGRLKADDGNGRRYHLCRRWRTFEIVCLRDSSESQYRLLMTRGAQQLLVVLATACALGLFRPELGGAAFQWLPDADSYANNEAIRYTTSAPSDAVARLQRRIDAGTTQLSFHAGTGYLKSVLHALDISVASQLLVFSKTSSQRNLISPVHPRAIYFSPGVYVGWVPGAQRLEVASVDPQLGAVFYSLRQEMTVRPRFQRETHNCLQCHESASHTSGVPGLIMKSVSPRKNGEPILSAGAYVTTDQSPFNERWGGWYVTGTHGAQLHMGNLTAHDTIDGPRMELVAGANVTDLGHRVSTDLYLTRHSDIVALMVFEHQKHVQNLITRLNYRTRMALYFDGMRNVELGRGVDFLPPSTTSLISREAEPLVEAMLFVREAPLTDPVAGTSGFATEFASEGPRDKSGRSLRDLDLREKLFRYGCSYLIYSESFDALPAPAKDMVYSRLWAVLSGEDQSAVFRHITPVARSAITEILLDTKADFAVWRAAHAHAANVPRSH